MLHPDLNNLRRAARREGGVLVRAAGPVQQRPDRRFWQLWAAGTFTPLALGLLLHAPPVIVVGLGTLLVNVGLAWATDRYTARGALTVWGRWVATVAGWIGAAVIAMACLAVAIGIMLTVAVLIGLTSSA
jgi:hypothetical protein